MEWEQDVARATRDATRALGGRRYPIADAAGHIANAPGLYAIHGLSEVWQCLGLEPRDLEIPLYVGKSEQSLATREMKTHFAIDRGAVSKTGGSTVRRSFAALLHDELQLVGVPRNKKNPGHFDKFALEPDADARLTDWMHMSLTLAVWPKPHGLEIPLKRVETNVIKLWAPPINLDNAPRPLARLVAGRAAMAAEARGWSE